jgi:hypothetical protein
MTFIHGYLLGGLLLAGVPVLLHLIMRQKPRRLTFPAFRFLRQRHRINQRKLRLQHLLLLLLRVLVVAALCLALARPRVFSQRLSLSNDRPVSAVLVFDTSASMGYTVAGQTRLDEAKRRARELLAEMGDGSEVTVLDSGDDTHDTPLPKGEALARVEALRIRYAAGPLNPALERAFRLLEKAGAAPEPPPRLLYVFSDRTRACWAPGTSPLALPAGVQAVFVDVGLDNPRDLAIDGIEVSPPVVPPGGPYQVRVAVRGTGAAPESMLSFEVDEGPGAQGRPELKAPQLGGDQATDVLVFERKAPVPPDDGPADMAYPITVKLVGSDALPFNNARFATLLVRRPRRLLTVVDRPLPKRSLWYDSIQARRNFACEVKTLAEVEKLTPKDLAAYKVVCLFEVAAPPGALWAKLAAYVREGGGLMVVPGGQELVPKLDAYNAQATPEGLLPASLKRLVDAPEDRVVYWAPFRAEHPLTAPFVRWGRSGDYDFTRPESRPFVRRYWEVSPVGKGALTVASYAGPPERPALVEKPLGQGRVLLFTTPLDWRKLDSSPVAPAWHNYGPPGSSFGLVLIDRACLYLAGEATLPELNFLCGQVPQLLLPATAEAPLSLRGPELAASEGNLATPAEGARLAAPQAQAPGHFAVLDGKGHVLAGFSLNVRAEESDLSRVPVEEVEAVLGPNSVLQVGRSASLADAIQASRPPPVELLPYLMLLLVLVLTVEGLLANKFYRRQGPAGGADEATPADAPPSPRALS